jgi:type I restriction enzyme, S subunit
MNQRRALRAYAEVNLGRQRSPESDIGPFMVPYLRAANVKDGTLDLTDVKSMNFSPSEQAVFSLKRGDVLVTEGSGSLTSVGASATWNADLPGTVCFQNTLLRLRPRPGTDPRFLAWWCRYAFVDGLFASIATGANIFHVSAERVRSLPMTNLPLNFQRQIADYLDRETARIDALISSKELSTALLEERWQAVMHDAVAGLLTLQSSPRRISGLPWLTDFPNHWQEGLLKLVAKLGSGHTPSRSHPEWWVDTTIPWITTGEVSQMRADRIEYITQTRERISEVGMANSAATLHQAGTVVLCRTASAGYSAIMGGDMATSQDFATWTCGPLLRPRFLLLCLRVMRADLLGRLAMGSTHKTIYMPDIESIKVPIPPTEEQDAIVEAAYSRLRPIDACAAALRVQISLLEERRQALITAAVTGQVTIPEAA